MNDHRAVPTGSEIFRANAWNPYPVTGDSVCRWPGKGAAFPCKSGSVPILIGERGMPYALHCCWQGQVLCQEWHFTRHREMNAQVKAVEEAAMEANAAVAVHTVTPQGTRTRYILRDAGVPPLTRYGSGPVIVIAFVVAFTILMLAISAG